MTALRKSTTRCKSWPWTQKVPLRSSLNRWPRHQSSRVRGGPNLLTALPSSVFVSNLSLNADSSRVSTIGLLSAPPLWTKLRSLRITFADCSNRAKWWIMLVQESSVRKICHLLGTCSKALMRETTRRVRRRAYRKLLISAHFRPHKYTTMAELQVRLKCLMRAKLRSFHRQNSKTH